MRVSQYIGSIAKPVEYTKISKMHLLHIFHQGSGETRGTWKCLYNWIGFVLEKLAA